MNIMIVDDEEKIRLGLSKLIHKASPHYRIAGIYASASECLAALEGMKPDVVITDIKMPGMTGLELAKAIKQIDSTIQCVILSGFGEFEYARSAIGIGVSAYLLKPVDKQELYDLLDRLYQQVQAAEPSSSDRDESLLKQILLSDAGNQAAESLFKEVYADFIRFPSYAITAVVTDSPMPAASISSWVRPAYAPDCKVVQIDERTTVCIVAFDKQYTDFQVWEKTLHDILIQEKKIQASIGISNPCTQFSGWGRCLKEALEACEYNYYRAGKPAVTWIENANFGTLHEVEAYRKKVLESMEIFDLDNVEVHLHEMLKVIAEIKLRMHHLVELMETLFYALNKEAGKRQTTLKQQEFSMDFGKELKNCFSFSQAKAFIELRLMSGLHSLASERTSQGSVTIYQIKKIIEQEYADSLDLNQLAKRVFLTPSYVSKLFKQETGTTIIEYIISVRMNKAKELLKEQIHLKTYQIGEMVGYRDPAYFNKQFKKVVGLTPKEYRDTVC
ncbi:response regulator transcription factor [Paenibacillus hexagrammi]|uniref:Response regulator n=1 Tax=Paenibacillus hexagrammi TaxID=2908839 RepID=A0ABY3SGW4_9BACL|nr:response regulator [Paenibacillus sp. YPD9-1]UJF32728.1 response regulator [Paenibacillus sp. YPD9-1]